MSDLEAVYVTVMWLYLRTDGQTYWFMETVHREKQKEAKEVKRRKEVEKIYTERRDFKGIIEDFRLDPRSAL